MSTAMRTVGETQQPFNVMGVKPGCNEPEEKGVSAFEATGDAKDGVAQRATFIVDPDNVIPHVFVNNLNVGRHPDEVLRILDGLQTDELCPATAPSAA